MSRMRTVAGIVALPLLAGAVAAAGALAPSPDPEASSTDEVEVAESTYACPAGSVITVGSGQLKAGQDRKFRVTPDGSVDPAAEDAARWSAIKIAGEGAIVTQTGEESGAVGFFAGKAPKNGGGGMVVGRCGEVVDDAWFLGLGTADRQSSTLILANMSDSVAVVDINLWGPNGQVDAVGGSGLAVDPNTVRRISVEDFAAGEPQLAMQVVRRRGLLTAMVNDSSTATFAGTEPIGITQPPSTDQLIPGLGGGARGKTLLLMNPGDQTARVSVRAYGSEGPFADEALQDIKVEAGRYAEVEVPESSGGGAQGLRVTSDRAVAASLRIEPNDEDYAIAEAGPLLDGPAVVPVSLGEGISAPRLVLTAPDQAAQATVVAYDADMKEVGRGAADIPAETTVNFDSKSLETTGDMAYLVVEVDGDVAAAATYTDGSLVSSLLLEPAPTQIDVPVVKPG